MLPWKPLFLFIVLLQFLPRHTCNYTTHVINSTYGCQDYDDNINVERSKGAILKYDPGENGRPVSFECSLIVTMPRGVGIAAVTQNINLRKRKNGKCVDYIKYFRNINNMWMYGPEHCGTINLEWNISAQGGKERHLLSSSNLPTREDPWHSPEHVESALSDGSFVMSSGSILVMVHIGNETDEDEVMPELTMAFTPYHGCLAPLEDNIPDTMFFHCGYNICIEWQFVGDGIANCPFPDIADEYGMGIYNQKLEVHHPVWIVAIVASVDICISFGALLYYIKFYRKTTDRRSLPPGEVKFDNYQSENNSHRLETSDTATD